MSFEELFIVRLEYCEVCDGFHEGQCKMDGPLPTSIINPFSSTDTNSTASTSTSIMDLLRMSIAIAKTTSNAFINWKNISWSTINGSETGIS